MSCFTNSWYVKIRTFNLTRTFGTGKKIRILYLILYWVCNYVEVYLCRECIRQKINAIFYKYSTLMLFFIVFLPLRINNWIQFSNFIQPNQIIIFGFGYCFYQKNWLCLIWKKWFTCFMTIPRLCLSMICLFLQQVYGLMGVIMHTLYIRHC